MKRNALIFFLTILSVTPAISQSQPDSTDSVSMTVLNDTLVSAAIFSDTVPFKENESLLPTHYLPTQRLLWSEKGLMRKIGYFTLSEESRDRELEIRDVMFRAHRYLGYATLAGMIAEGFVGERLYRGNSGLKDVHEGLAGAVNFGYFASASMALFAPPRATNRAPGFSTAKLHKYLSFVHLTSMIATNILSGMTEDNPSIRPYHRAAAYTAFGSFFAAIVVVHF
jgi:hypothetical protein